MKFVFDFLAKKKIVIVYYWLQNFQISLLSITKAILLKSMWKHKYLNLQNFFFLRKIECITRFFSSDLRKCIKFEACKRIFCVMVINTESKNLILYDY